jgi:hypothetical protein
MLFPKGTVVIKIDDNNGWFFGYDDSNRLNKLVSWSIKKRPGQKNFFCWADLPLKEENEINNG